MQPEQGPETILLVDDEPMVRKLAATLLRVDGYHVIEASDAAEALALGYAHAAELDLLLTDVCMPGRSGLELARDLAEVRPDLPVVFMSGYNEYALELEGRGAEMIAKPFAPTTLLERVRLLVSNKDASATTNAFA